MDICCYSQRILNPFRGVMNIIRYQSAEAVSLDGIHWDIYVSNQFLLQDLDERNRVQTSDIRYGRWSREAGLTRGPMVPSDDFIKLAHLGEVVYQHLLRVAEDVPFSMQDDYELWLLDTDHRPLALIDSVVWEEDMHQDRQIDWRAGLQCRRCFNPALESNAPGKFDNPATYLTQYVNQCADIKPSAQWFYRDVDGHGMGMQGINLDPALTQRYLHAHLFPDLLLEYDSHDYFHQNLIDEFFNWQAPWLLLLHDLDNVTRKQYEFHAKKQAMVVDSLYNLYPNVVDEAQIKAARIEAMMRRSQLEVVVEEEDVMATFYIELGKS